jgi:hypothetical protein
VSPILTKVVTRWRKASLTCKAAVESTARPAELAPTQPTARVTAGEPANVSTPTTESIPITTCSGERKRVSGQSSGESRSRSQNDHGLT